MYTKSNDIWFINWIQVKKSNVERVSVSATYLAMFEARLNDLDLSKFAFLFERFFVLCVFTSMCTLGYM